MPGTRLHRLRQGLVWLGAAGVLALVFAAYLQPAVIVELGNRLWSCF